MRKRTFLGVVATLSVVASSVVVSPPVAADPPVVPVVANTVPTALVAATPFPHIESVIAAIGKMEDRTESDTSYGSLWNFSTTNALGGVGVGSPGSWIVDTHHCWNVSSCDSTAEQAHITTTIRSIVGSGETLVDLSGLTGFPDGAFRQAIIDGARDAYAAGHRPVIRMLWGHTPLYDVGDKKLKSFYRDVKAVAPGIRVVAASASNTPGLGSFFWNHSKIVAADGKTAFVSGINMWSHSYLQSTHPVTDLGLVVSGTAARDAQKFLDVQWRDVCANPGSSLKFTNTILPSASNCPGTMTTKLDPDASLAAANGGSVGVLSLGRGGRIYDGRKVGEGAYPEVSAADRLATTCPGIFNVMNGGARWDGRNPSDTGLRALVDSARTNVTIFQQNMMFPCPVGKLYDVRLFDAIARKLQQGIPVNIVTSNTSAAVRDDAGLTEPESDYKALPVAKVQKTLIDRVEKLGNTEAEATAVVCRNLMVAPLRVSTSGKWNDAEDKFSSPAMHTKLFMVDDQAFSIGSQNAYPNELAEFTYLVENKSAAAELKSRFIDPVLELSRAGAAPCPRKVSDETPTGPTGPQIAVSLGDSYISGEAGRWGGNVVAKSKATFVDRLGERAYWDTTGKEKISGCHRAAGAEVQFWPGSINLACSGAITSSKWKGVYPIGWAKPGIDRKIVHGVDGQLRQLEDVTKDHTVKLVLLSIGGNDFGFSKVVATCAASYSFSTRANPKYCKDTNLVREAFSNKAMDTLTDKVSAAISRIIDTMRNAGYDDADWSLVVQNYPKAIPDGKDFRYPQTNARISQGGCGFWNADADYINDKMSALSGAIWNAVYENRKKSAVSIKRLDLTRVFEGHRLCEKGTDVADGYTELASFEPVAEYIQSLRLNVIGTEFSPAESVHPNFYGQQLLQECAKAAWNDGNVRSGKCVGRDTPGAVPPNATAKAWLE